MTDERLTANFWLSEFLASDTAARLGIDNTPTAMVEATIRNVLAPGMQAVRDLLGVPVQITSGYRSPKLNAAVRGSQGSQHCSGHAADFRAPGFGTPRRVCELLVQRMALVRFDQLIHEGSWVHISFAPRQRNEVLTAHFRPDGVSYTRGLS
ncbi:MAG TPA: D-Ala-D-Ala carboxypeptidase family metallohydrolase [Methylibium sp.]|nr:D-Ala-D-Ala carboxypeptidase family metallohydrolase [Methylibium sp.]